MHSANKEAQTRWENDMSDAYKVMFDMALRKYDEMVGWEQEWEESNRENESAIFKANDAYDELVTVCIVMAKESHSTVSEVLGDVEAAYTGR